MCNSLNKIFIPYEAQKILDIPTLNRTTEDTITWAGTMDGNYTVKDGYQAIMDWSEEGNNGAASSSTFHAEIWSNLWKINVPPKHSHFLWRLLNNALPTKTNLAKRGVKCDPFCPRCPTKMETTNHVFLDCEWAKQVWLASQLTINLHQNPIPNIADWIRNAIATTNKDCMEQITAITYSLWYARNLLVFQGKQLPQEDISKLALSHLQEYQKLCAANLVSRSSHVAGRSSNDTSWSPPLGDTLKINVDAHLRRDGRWSSGLILRRSDGSIVGAATRSHAGASEAIFGEAMGLNDALDMAGRYNASAITFKLDSMIIVKAVKDKAKIRRNGGFAIQRCIEFLQANPRASINWTRRENNRVAHELARWAEVEPNFDWHSNIPMCIKPFIQKDMGAGFCP
jgi:ribonuclease HI